MDHGMNRTEGPPLTQCNSGKLFSLNTAHEAQFSVINDGVSSYKIQSPSDSFNIALEILNGVGIAQSDKLLPSSQVGFDLFSRDSNASMDLQTLAQRLYGLTTGLPDATLRDLATISHFLTREKSSLNTLEPTTAATTSLATAATNTTTTAMLPEDRTTGRATLSGTGFGRLCSVDSFSGTNEQALNQLTHWSNALSNAPQSVVKAFQHAQAQMALLGLSSPQPNEFADPRSANREVANRTRTH
ncbi:hypothetical protein FGIG_05658 [Fasciola gigantica]|uniref:Uncharacterized protein n=1 Tax=Fasciola gigantica TaxID=46835 RepID=A0A504YTE0_FASGI|nr:hypothetical protein FGIG_05658 [Fasciola gigantica]